ncbi:hypothetical protein SteCoe_14318 [Stentor coeruleus]|uniref:Uncharacterized protein n=1 Tax=Stentor coeruleus TaxID=5963 RepID=A0A1R2C6G4_9CILI|nr:hypothetical protein SteCoe_14318 [Stentor coeruleus]
MSDQLEEYRKKMQDRYRGGPNNSSRDDSRSLQDEERKRKEQQLREDEELARKLQGDHYPSTPVRPPPSSSNVPQAYRPPDYIPAGQNVPPVNAYAPPNQIPPPQYNQYPPANYNPPPPQVPRGNYQAPRANSSYNQPAYNAASTGLLPVVNDKCCGINTQTCVLVTAAVMTVGIIASLIALSTG